MHAAHAERARRPWRRAAPTKLLYLTDPDGTRIELMENVPDLSLMAPDAAAALTDRFDPPA